MKWIDNLKRFFGGDDNKDNGELQSGPRNINQIRYSRDNSRETNQTKQEKRAVEPLPIDFNLRILVVADTHTCLSRDDVPSSGYDVCLLLGDMSPMDMLIVKETVGDVPIYGVLGNHDGFGQYERMGIENIHGKVVEVNGVRIAGIGGSLRYKCSAAPLYTDDESIEIADSMDNADILISHDSPKFLHSIDDYAHSGLQGITHYCEKYNVPINIHGHHHDPKECVLDNGTRAICCYQVQIVQISPNGCVIH
jgi:Icc-related predicted phosphoesterase